MNGVSTEAAPAKASTRKHLHWNFWRKHTGSTHQPRRSHGEDTAPAEGRDIGWTKAKTLFWPEELLPQDVRQSRIYTWGYDVDINHIFSSAGQATTFQHAQSLLLDLGNERISAEDVSL
jgi:hypothetical protein